MNQNTASKHFPTLSKVGRGIAFLFRRTYKYTLAVLIALAVVHGIATFILGRRVESRLKAIKAKGELVSPAEFGGPKVPDAENAALIYAKAFKVIEPAKEDTDFQGLDSFLDPEERAKDPELWNKARRAVARYGKAFPLVDEALSRPKCQFPVNWEAGWNAVFRHYAPLRSLARLLAADAMIQARDGRMDQAVHSIDLALRMSKSAPNDPIVLAPLVQAAMVRVSTVALRDILQHGNLTDAQATELYETLGSIDLGPAFVKAMQGERALGIWGFEYVRENPKSIIYLGSGEEAKRGGFGWRLLWWVWRPVLYADEGLCLDHMGKAVHAARLPFRDTKARRLASDDPDFPRWAIMSSIFTLVFARARMKADDAMAEAAGSQIALALRVYKNRYGAYPDTLDELRAKLGWQIPKDIFSGKDFVYRPLGNGFVLYSIGGNLKDDRARPLTPTPAPQTNAAYWAQARGYDYTNAKGQKVADIVWEFDW